MKLFGWIQSKLNRGNICKEKSSNKISSDNYDIPEQESSREEFTDWPKSLLTIGTLGTENLTENQEISKNSGTHHQETPSPSQDHHCYHHHLQGITPEDIGKLQKEFISLLQPKQEAVADTETRTLPNDSFEDLDSTAEDDGTLQVVIKGKDLCVDGTKKVVIKKTSVSFLLKKIFVCRSGFSPVPSLRDPPPEPRMGKILRAILHRKIYPHQSSSGQAISPKKFIGDKHLGKLDSEDETSGSKWDRTDSEYIVLEI